MTNLMTHDEIDAFITEYDGGCYHDWEASKTTKHLWKCKKCRKLCQALSKPDTIPHPIARNLGKLVDYAVEKGLFDNTENGIFGIHPSKTQVGIVEIIDGLITKKPRFIAQTKDYDTSELAACAALGTGMCAVLKAQKS